MTTENAPGTADPEKELLLFLEGHTGTPWEPDTDLFRAGGLSSLFAMQLVVHLEKSYAIAIRGANLRLDNFRTVRQMVALVERLRQPASGSLGG
ncbi:MULTISPECIES: acyl carrier protein [Streptomyces]|uniref:Acyl carrier protein n=1 Tax=Streptomyces tsukubensis (strain DSM 42081 / NBRC 108919 / NRRL 18488 / 9993) TaxID=1114943 RepID=I2NAW1_STRT9|nr:MULTISPECIES: acyl carrier protein [Streptomyces]AZK97914.1 methoxymalonate biosynthesis protein [Streptomyces tsukubensis]EIF94158.1 methoxymalonate biosynthesis protein [Streptomyces tsukubensis NRRL18488]MYS62734.1 acyl carrier protein [Streptomyces sp. SID5473]QKM66158.1 acyl carrier protein [Streptomyces tsukubensis NRRL18488]TAI42439.1 acyl carrier protein [Streptomyces tsukubensis]